MKNKLYDYEEAIIEGLVASEPKLTDVNHRLDVYDSNNHKLDFVTIDRSSSYSQIMELNIMPLIIKTFKQKDRIIFELKDNSDQIEDGRVEKILKIVLEYGHHDGTSKITANYCKCIFRAFLDEKIDFQNICEIVQKDTGAYSINGNKTNINLEDCNADNYLSIIMNNIKNCNNGELWQMFKDGVSVIYPGLKVSIDSFMKNWMYNIDEIIKQEQKGIEEQKHNLLMNILYVELLKKIKDDYQGTYGDEKKVK